MQRKLVAWLMVAYLIILFGLTLGFLYQRQAPINLIPFRSIEHDLRKGGSDFVVNLVGNVVVFFPMGWAIPVLLGRRLGAIKVLVLSLLLSCLIECLQGISGRRVADIDDVILNTLGGLIGHGLAEASTRIRRLGKRHPENMVSMNRF